MGYTIRKILYEMFTNKIFLGPAAGVRLETQRQGKALNALNEERKEAGMNPFISKDFREKLGHTIPEILVGMLIGIMSGIIVIKFLPF